MAEGFRVTIHQVYREIGSLASRGVSCDTAQGRALARCDTALARVALGHDTVIGPATRAGQGAQGRRARRAWHSAQGRAALCLRYGARAPRHGSLRLRYGRAAKPRYIAGLATTMPRAREPGRAWCAGWASWGLMQPVWFLTWFIFYSVVFLSHCLDSVHEHFSLQKKIHKKKFKF